MQSVHPISATSFYIICHRDGTKEKVPVPPVTDKVSLRDAMMGHRGTRRNKKVLSSEISLPKTR